MKKKKSRVITVETFQEALLFLSFVVLTGICSYVFFVGAIGYGGDACSDCVCFWEGVIYFMAIGFAIISGICFISIFCCFLSEDYIVGVPRDKKKRRKKAKGGKRR